MSSAGSELSQAPGTSRFEMLGCNAWMLGEDKHTNL